MSSSTSSTLDPTTPERQETSLSPDTIRQHTLGKRPWRRNITPFDRILHHPYPGSGTPEDPYLVDWLPSDPEDPQQWNAGYQWLNILVASIAALAVTLSSSAYTGGIASLATEFEPSLEVLTAGISLFVAGFAFGPILWAPLSEIYGRRPVYCLTYTGLALWTAATPASQNIETVLVFRFLAGFFGSSPLANAGGTIYDVLNAQQRGIGMALMALAPFIGPALGPITGGFIGLTSGWRWIFAFLAIFCAVIAIVTVLFTPETYAPRLLRDRSTRLSRFTGKAYRIRADSKGTASTTQVLLTALSRPGKFLFLEPIVACLSLYNAVIYGTLYLCFSAFPIIFEQGHGWNTGVGGLAFVGILVGTLLSVVIYAVQINPAYLKTVKRGRALPEDRLVPTLWAGVVLAVSLACFAATCSPDIHWIVPIIFSSFFGLSLLIIYLSSVAYLVDTYTVYAASVLAGNSILRSLFGAAFPLFTNQMYQNLGVRWAASIPAFLALLCLPFPFVFYRYGAVIRARCKYSADAERQMAELAGVRPMAEVTKDVRDPVSVETGQKSLARSET